MIYQVTKKVRIDNPQESTLASIKALKRVVNESQKKGETEVAVSVRYLEDILSKISVPTKTPKKNEKISCMEKRNKIFKAAIEVFAEEGYHKATMDKIATLSGVAKGTVYRYFKSKDDLLEQLILGKFQEILGYIGEIYSKNFDILHEIQEMIEFWVGYIEDNHNLYRLIQNKAVFQRTGQKLIFYNYMASHLHRMKERIVALDHEKKLKPTNFYTVFYGILGFIDGVVHKWFRSGMAYSLRSEIPVILEVIFNGFVGEKWREVDI